MVGRTQRAAVRGPVGQGGGVSAAEQREAGWRGGGVRGALAWAEGLRDAATSALQARLSRGGRATQPGSGLLPECDVGCTRW